MKLRVAVARVARVPLDTVVTGALSSRIVTSASSLWAMGIATWMAPVGQASTQAWHSTHREESIQAMPSTSEIAP